jgi:hypothetical protein
VSNPSPYTQDETTVACDMSVSSIGCRLAYFPRRTSTAVFGMANSTANRSFGCALYLMQQRSYYGKVKCRTLSSAVVESWLSKCRSNMNVPRHISSAKCVFDLHMAHGMQITSGSLVLNRGSVASSVKKNTSGKTTYICGSVTRGGKLGGRSDTDTDTDT